MGGPRRRPPVPGRAPADLDAVAHAGDRARRRRPRPPARLRQRVLRCGRTARADRAGAPRGRGRPARRRHPRARDRLGGPARLPSADAADRRPPRRAHLHQRVHPGAPRARRWAGGRGWPSCRPGSTSTGSPPGSTARRSAVGTASATPPSSSASPASWPARGRTCSWLRWPRVLARHPDARLLLVGGGPDEAAAAPGRRRPRPAGLRRPHRCGAARRTAGALRRRRRLRDAVPDPAGAVSTSRGWGWSSSRRPPAACRCWPGRPAARRRRSRRA